MNVEAPNEEQQRVLCAGPASILTDPAVRQLVASAGETIVVASAAAAKLACGAFDQGVFAFDLPDGSGIVLAAELMLENRLRDVQFVHPGVNPPAPV